MYMYSMYISDKDKYFQYTPTLVRICADIEYGM